MTIIRIAAVAATVMFGATLTGTAHAECRDLVCGLLGELGTAVQKGPHAAAQDAAASARIAGVSKAEAAGRKAKPIAKKRRALRDKPIRRQPPMPALSPASDPSPVEVVPPETINAIDLAAGPAPAADGEPDAADDEVPSDGISGDETARSALAAALDDVARQMRSAPPAPAAESLPAKSLPAKSLPPKTLQAKSWLDRVWTVVADAIGAARAAVRTLVG